MTTPDKPIVLVLGSTGQTGQLVVKELDRYPDQVQIRLCSRRNEEVEHLQNQGREAVLLDLDDPRTFGDALAGVDRIYLLTGYTVAMLVQSKTLVDAAIKAGVQYIVHQGIFGQWDCTDPHFVWHQLIERYIEASGIAWTHLHPNYFMENLLNVTPLKASSFSMYCGDKRVGWVALQDVAAVAATVLLKGPEKYGGKDYWMSTEAFNGPEVAAILSEVLSQEISCELKQPEVLWALLTSSESKVELNYAAGAVEFMRQVIDGRMGYVGSVRDDVSIVTGRASTTLRQWVAQNRERLRNAAAC